MGKLRRLTDPISSEQITQTTSLVEKAVKAAESFINGEKNQPTKQTEVDTLLNANVARIAQQHSNDAQIQSLYQRYGESTDPKKYSQFTKSIENYLTFENKLGELKEVFTSSGVFFSQVATLTNNRHMAIAAKAMTITAGTLDSVEKFSNIVSCIQAGGLSALSFSSFMSGAGAVLGGLSMAQSLFGRKKKSSGDGGLGIALFQISQQMQQIHNTLYEMWGDTAKRFEATWEMLSTMEQNNQRRFEIMDANNQRRFEFTLNSINYVNQNLLSLILNERRHQEVLEKAIIDIGTRIDNAVNFLRETDIQTTMQEIKIAISELPSLPEAEFKNWLRNYFKKYTSKLKIWLMNTTSFKKSTITTLNGEFQINSNQLLQMLREAMSIEYQKNNNIPLDLFASLANQFDNKISLEQGKILNPHSWLYIFEIYTKLWDICISKGWILSEETTKIYQESLSEISQVAHYNFMLMEKIANSPKVWEMLVKGYQHKITLYNTELRNERPPTLLAHVWPKTFGWDLKKTAPENIEYFTKLPDMAGFLHNTEKSYSWVGLPGIRDKDKVPLKGYVESALIHRDDHIPQHDISYALTHEQYNLITTQTSCKSIDTIKKDPAFIIAKLYGLADSRLYYALYNIGRLVYWGDFTLFLYPHIVLNGTEYPLCYVRLFRSFQDGGMQDFGKISDFLSLKSGTFIGTPEIHFNERHLPQDPQTPLHEDNFFSSKKIIEAIEENILRPARKRYVNKHFSDDRLIEEIQLLKMNYYKITAFVQLFDPSFEPNLSPRALSRIEECIKKLKEHGDAKNFKDLLEVTQGTLIESNEQRVVRSHVWQEEFWDYIYMGNRLRDFNSEDLRLRATNSFKNIFWVKMLKEAPQRIETIKKKLLEILNQRDLLKQANESILVQQELIDNSFDVINTQLDVLVKLGHNNKQLAQWNKNFQGLLAARNSLFNNNRLSFSDSAVCLDDSQPKISRISTGTTLQQLCSDTEVDYHLIEKELERLVKEGDSKLQAQLNTENDSHRPLHLAILARRADLVELLLSYDAVIKPENKLAINSVSCDEVSMKIAALLDFHQYLKSFSLNEKLRPGRTLSLIKNGIDKLRPYINHPKPAVIISGKSGKGKSLISNIHWCNVVYEDFEGDLKLKPGYKECAITSDGASSETIYPQIFGKADYSAVDLPGFCDSKGPPYKVAAGITMQMLYSIFKNITAILGELETPHFS
jgi:hypothetical protein